MSIAKISVGELERDVLEVLWCEARDLSVHDVTAALRGKSLAYTTVLTVLVRLFEKGLLVRVKDGRAFLYAPKVTREAFAAQRALDVLSARGRSPDRGMLLAFLDSAEEEDPAILDRLTTLLAERRARREK